MDYSMEDNLPNLAETPVINPEVFEALRAECPDLVVRLINLFFESAAPAFSALETSAAIGDAAGIFASAHLLRGSASNFGADRFVMICEEIENLSKAGETGEIDAKIMGLLGALRIEFQSVIQALTPYDH